MVQGDGGEEHSDLKGSPQGFTAGQEENQELEEPGKLAGKGERRR